MEWVRQRIEHITSKVTGADVIFENKFSCFNFHSTKAFYSRFRLYSNVERPAAEDDKMFVISEMKLLGLFQCGYHGAEGKISSIDGTQTTMSQTCLQCDAEWKWKSREMIGKYLCGNIRLSTAILCAGAVLSKAIQILRTWGVQGMTSSTYFRHQGKFLLQAVRTVWEEESISALGDTANYLVM
jgi:hypothetical protein